VLSEASDLWGRIIAWISEHHVGDLASIAGVIISLVGFFLTVVAATRAKQAAQRALENIRALDTVIDFTTAITLLEEIKTLHRSGQVLLIPDRCAAARKLLIALRSSNYDLSATHRTAIQAAIVHLKDVESAVEKAATSPGSGRSVKLTSLMSQHIDDLLGVLAEIKPKGAGG
jgi:hypothetical protein